LVGLAMAAIYVIFKKQPATTSTDVSSSTESDDDDEVEIDD